MNPTLRIWTALLSGTLLVGVLAAAPDDGDKREAFTAEVTKGDLTIEVELAGSFVAENKDEIRIEPKAYKGDLIITSLRPEGAAIKKGEPLIEFDPLTLDRSLEDARNELSDNNVALDKATAEFEAFRIDQDGTLDRKGKTLQMAKDGLAAAREKTTIELTDKEKSIKDAENNLGDGRVDFEQLTQLYKERELHTATENILIDREKRRIQDLERRLEKTKREVALWKKFEKDKDSREKEIEVAKQEAELKQAEIKLAAELKEKRAEVDKAKREVEKSDRKVKELEGDAASLKVMSPRDGIVFYGSIGGDTMSGVVIFGLGGQDREMRVGGRVRTHQILMTVASMDRLSVQMSVMENEIQYMKAGLPVTIRPDAFPSLKLTGKLSKVDQVASRNGIFSDVREFKVHGEYEGVFPQLRSGMNCRVTVHADTIPDAVQVPVLAVFIEGGEFYCLVKNGSQTKRRKVKLGATNGTRVQITEGVRAGEVVSLWNPNEG
ncbi:MAG: efflux RND transporter periplasmic adaptor subunit [Planctomycetes bacterium]|nr:efflux RND transporter periplasmic adaptor subunit [Planctomycetota bacterium]